MAFLEALARGCAVFAYNGQTMSDYIKSGTSGYLFRRSWSWDIQRRIRQGRVNLARHNIGRVSPLMISLQVRNQNWNEISNLNLELLGQEAQRQQQIGYQTWQAQIPGYARFLLGTSKSPYFT
jgi:hypothetical protein